MINWSKYYNSIPAKIIIGKSVYKIFWVDEYPKDNKQLGETNFSPIKYISININQTVKESVMTYWHEILHAMSYEYNANLTEKQVLALEKSLPLIIKRDNMFKGEKKHETNKRKRRNFKRIR